MPGVFVELQLWNWLNCLFSIVLLRQLVTRVDPKIIIFLLVELLTIQSLSIIQSFCHFSTRAWYGKFQIIRPNDSNLVVSCRNHRNGLFKCWEPVRHHGLRRNTFHFVALKMLNIYHRVYFLQEHDMENSKWCIQLIKIIMWSFWNVDIEFFLEVGNRCGRKACAAAFHFRSNNNFYIIAYKYFYKSLSRETPTNAHNWFKSKCSNN